MIQQNNIDISVFNYELYNESGNLIRIKNNGSDYFECSGLEAIQSLWDNGLINIGLGGRMFKLSLWKDISFRECFSEDLATMHNVVILVSKVGDTYEVGVNYLVRNNSSIILFQEKN